MDIESENVFYWRKVSNTMAIGAVIECKASWIQHRWSGSRHGDEMMASVATEEDFDETQAAQALLQHICSGQAEDLEQKLAMLMGRLVRAAGGGRPRWNSRR